MFVYHISRGEGRESDGAHEHDTGIDVSGVGTRRGKRVKLQYLNGDLSAIGLLVGLKQRVSREMQLLAGASPRW